jgi:hypothetical protein
MPREIGGKRYLTLDEAARKLRVSSRTLSGWLRKKLITPPREVAHGLRSFYAFTDGWIEDAKAEIAEYRRNKKTAAA